MKLERYRLADWARHEAVNRIDQIVNEMILETGELSARIERITETLREQIGPLEDLVSELEANIEEEMKPL